MNSSALPRCLVWGRHSVYFSWMLCFRIAAVIVCTCFQRGTNGKQVGVFRFLLWVHVRKLGGNTPPSKGAHLAMGLGPGTWEWLASSGGHPSTSTSLFLMQTRETCCVPPTHSQSSVGRRDMVDTSTRALNLQTAKAVIVHTQVHQMLLWTHLFWSESYSKLGKKALTSEGLDDTPVLASSLWCRLNPTEIQWWGDWGHWWGLTLAKMLLGALSCVICFLKQRHKQFSTSGNFSR